MSGKQVFNWREGDRNEYLASFLLSALGLVNPVPRQDDAGVDFYCSLADQEKGATTIGFPFMVQVRSLVKPVVHLKPPKRYRHQKGVIPDHLSGFVRQDLPMFLALVDKEAMSIRLFSLSALWFLHYDREHCADCSSLRLVPRLDGSESGLVGPPRRLGQMTSSPESHEYEVDLGFPVASLSVEESANRGIVLKQKSNMRTCIEADLRTIMLAHAELPQFSWIAETDPEMVGPVPEVSCQEAPGDSARLKQIYSFLGPALIPLALRYKADQRSDLLGALRTLLREMPDGTIPPKIQKALPEIFGK